MNGGTDCAGEDDAAATAGPDSDIGAILVSSRSFEEYRAMFTLTETDRCRKILDCPGGAASLTAEVSLGGGDATACDPEYGLRGPEELASIAQSDVERGNGYVRSHPEQYRWTHFVDPDHHLRSRTSAVSLFTAHYRAHPERYVSGRLPNLPFDDLAFELSLSSYLLFSYADRLDLTFHREAIIELMRVTSEELRLFPVIGVDARAYPHLEKLLRQLDGDGVESQLVDVDYEFQARGNQMLVCRHR